MLNRYLQAAQLAESKDAESKKTLEGSGTSKLSSFFEQQIAAASVPSLEKPKAANKVAAIWKDKFETEIATEEPKKESTKRSVVPAKTMSRVANKWTPSEGEVKKTVVEIPVEATVSKNVWVPSESEVKKTVVEVPKSKNVWVPSENEVKKTVVELPVGAGASKVASAWQQLLDETEKKLQEEANLPEALRKKAESTKQNPETLQSPRTGNPVANESVNVHVHQPTHDHQHIHVHEPTRDQEHQPTHDHQHVHAPEPTTDHEPLQDHVFVYDPPNEPPHVVQPHQPVSLSVDIPIEVSQEVSPDTEPVQENELEREAEPEPEPERESQPEPISVTGISLLHGVVNRPWNYEMEMEDFCSITKFSNI